MFSLGYRMIALVLGVAVLVGSGLAGVPQLISYQGVLTDNSGSPLDGSFDMTFSLYGVVTGGTALWNEPQTVVVTDGSFSVHLGSVVELTDEVFADSVVYLGVQVDPDPEMARTRLTSSPFAYRVASVEGSISRSLVLVGDDNSRVELSAGTDVLKVFDPTGYLRVKLGLEASTKSDGGGSLSFYRRSVLAGKAAADVSLV